MRGKYFFHGVFYLLREEKERERGRKILIIRDKDGSMRPIPRSRCINRSRRTLLVAN